MSLTPLQLVELRAWHKAVKALGTFKSKAAEMGTTAAVLRSALVRMELREARGVSPFERMKPGRK